MHSGIVPSAWQWVKRQPAVKNRCQCPEQPAAAVQPVLSHQQLERHHLLVLDELGYVPFTKAGAELLFEVVSRAYERTSLLVTTNLPFEAWTEVLGNERLTGALLDRLTHRIHILEANGESYRLRESQRRLKQRTTTRARRHTS